jgi:hypothetical protein
MCYLKHPFQDVGSLGILNSKIHFPTDALAPSYNQEFIMRMLDVSIEFLFFHLLINNVKKQMIQIV